MTINKKREERGQSQKNRDVRTEAEIGSNIIWRWRKVPGAKKCRRLLDVAKGKETDSPLELPEGTQLCQHLDFSSKTPFGLPTSRTIR